MHQMDQMMNSVFGGFPNPMASMPFGGGMFGNFGSMLGGPMMMNHMSSMNDHMKNQMQMMVGGASGPNHSFSSSSSTFMSYSSNGPNGQPQVLVIFLILYNFIEYFNHIYYYLCVRCTKHQHPHVLVLEE